MKFKTTRKAITQEFSTIISIGYCSAQHLLYFENPIAYTTRAEGWGADIYQVGSVAVVTGYAPFGNIRPTYDLTQEYDRKAQQIISDRDGEWKDVKEKVSALLAEYIKRVRD